MRFKKLLLKNIRSYEDQEVNFPEGSLLLSGEIGSGKTTILLAIEYALFGLQPGQKGSSLLRNSSSIGEVNLTLEVDGKEVTIERKLRRGSKSVTNEYAAITINDEKSEISTTELKTKILDILGYPQEFVKKNNLLYRYTVYTPQEEMKQIILEDSETRLNVLRHIFGIDKYKRIRENLQIFLVKLKDDVKSLQTELRFMDEDKVKLSLKKQFLVTLGLRLNEKQFQFSELVTKRKSIELEMTDAERGIREREVFEKEVEKTKIVIGTKKELISSITRESTEISKSIADNLEPFRQEEYDYIISELNKKKTEISSLNSAFIQLSGQISSIEQKIKENTAKKDRIFSIEICPTCLQDVSEVHKRNIQNETEGEIVDLRKKLESLRREYLDASTAIDLVLSQRASFEERKTVLEIARARSSFMAQARKRLDEIVKNRESLEGDIKLLSAHMDGLKEHILSFSRYTNVFRLKQEELKKAFMEEKNAEIAMAEVRKEMEITNRDIGQIEDTIKKSEEKKIKLAELQDLQDWLTNQFSNLIEFTERNVLLKLRREFSNLFNSWFHILAGDSFEVQLDETFTPLVMQGEVEMDYGFLSGGERTSVALAYRLALNQIINSVLSKVKTRDIVILDEPTDGFSDSQIDKMRDVLEQLNVDQLIIVSHEQKIESFVDNILRLRKEGNISTIESPVEVRP
jgi:exonuclease SbcC